MAQKRRPSRTTKASPDREAPWPGGGARWLAPAAVAAIGALTLVIYAQTLSVPAINYEDSYYLIRNPYVNVDRPFARLGAVWTEPFFANFHPVTTTTWLVDRALADRQKPFDAVPFRITHLLYAALGAALLVPLLRRLGLPPILAAAGAVLYAVHPIHTEVVAWLSARKDLTALILVAASMLAYLAARESRSANGWWLGHGAAAVLTLLAVLSKPTAVVLPALFIAYEFCAAPGPFEWRRPSPVVARAAGLAALFAVAGGALLVVFRLALERAPERGAWLTAVPLALASAIRVAAPSPSQLEAARAGTRAGWRVFGPPHLVYASIFAAASAWTFWAQAASGAIKGGLSLLPTLNLTFDAMVSYLAKTFVPAYMSASYVWNEYPVVSARGVLGALLVAALLYAAVRMTASPAPLLRAAAFGIFWFFIALVPVSNLVPTSTKMADRYLFLPTIGAVVAALAVAAHFVPGRAGARRALLGAIALVALGYTAGAYDRTRVWCGKTAPWNGSPNPDLSIWTRAVETHPDNHSALTSLGLVYLSFTPPEPERALVHLERALQLSEAQQSRIADGKRLDISPLHQALGHAYLELARTKLASPLPEVRARKRDALVRSVRYLEAASRVPWGFPPSDARLLWRLSDAREELARVEDADARAGGAEAGSEALRRRDKLREESLQALARAREILIRANSPRDADFRLIVLAAGTAVFGREAGAPPEEQRRHFEAALGLYEEAAALVPDDPRPVFYQGLCRERLFLLERDPAERRRQFDLAEAAYRRALELSYPTPEYHPLLPYRGLASLYNSSGKSAAALEFLKQVGQRDPVYSRESGVDRDIQTLEAALARAP